MSHTRYLCSTLLAATMLLAVAALAPAHADGRLVADYAITFANVPVGKGSWKTEIGAERYRMTANGAAAGLARAIASGDGEVAVEGTVKDGKLAPETFTASLKRDDGRSDAKVVLRDGEAIEISGEAPPPSADRIAITAAHRKDIIDPLSALLIPAAGEAPGKDGCARTLPIFDGSRRYDLKLAFKRMDKVKADKGYAGPVAVCTVTFKPIAGYRPSSTLVKYLSDGRDIELWLAPVAGTNMLAPFELVIAGMLGNLVIEAKTFEAAGTSVRAAIEGKTAR